MNDRLKASGQTFEQSKQNAAGATHRFNEAKQKRCASAHDPLRAGWGSPTRPGTPLSRPFVVALSGSRWPFWVRVTGIVDRQHALPPRRYDTFMQAFNHVSETLNTIYKVGPVLPIPPSYYFSFLPPMY